MKKPLTVTKNECGYDIIRMVDSQVDFERKLILVVMKFGQKDLKCCALQE